MTRSVALCCLALTLVLTTPSASRAQAEEVAANASAHVLSGELVRVQGRLGQPSGPRPFVVEVRAAAGWRAVARGRTYPDGRLTARWRPRRLGRFGLRLRVADEQGYASREFERGLTVYRRAVASWYGPGFYGRRTACGRRIWRTTMGVAHRRLRCGALVTLRHRGRSVSVPVIDRGPYVRGRELDLSFATKRALRFRGVRVLWVTR